MKDKTLTLPLSSCSILGKFPTLSVPWVPHSFGPMSGRSREVTDIHLGSWCMFPQTASEHYWKMRVGTFFSSKD